MGELATVHVDGQGVATLTMRRPEARNALSLDLLEALQARLAEAASDEAVRVLILAGEGKAFCAGMDLKAVLRTPGAPAQLLGAIAELTLQLRAFPTPVIARVQGAAIGGGCGLACTADLTVTHPEAILGFPEVDLGVCPAVVAPWLCRRVGFGRARRILLAGGTMTGAEAHAQGLATTLAPTQRSLDEAVRAHAQAIAQASPLAVRATKRALNELEDAEALAAKVREGAQLSARIVESDETQRLLNQRFGLPG